MTRNQLAGGKLKASFDPLVKIVEKTSLICKLHVVQEILVATLPY